MPVWAIVLLVSLAVSVTMAGIMFLLMPKAPPPPGTPPLALPSTEIGKTVPVLFGSRVITNPSIVWWGDFAIIKVPAQAGGKK